MGLSLKSIGQEIISTHRYLQNIFREMSVYFLAINHDSPFVGFNDSMANGGWISWIFK